MRRDSITNLDVALNREVDSKYDKIRAVADKINEVETVANADLTQMSIDIQEILDFTDITTVTVPETSPAYWDADTKTLSIPEGKRGATGAQGDKGDTGATGATGPAGLDGIGVDHVVPTNTTQPEGKFGVPGYKDTYSLYGDSSEEILLGSFVVGNAGSTLGVVDFTLIEKDKLSGIENNATADQTGAEIKALYEAEPDTNEFTDAEKLLVAEVPNKQETLVSGTNIKTINGDNILGSGNLLVSAGAAGYSANVYFTQQVSSTVGTYKQLSYTPEELQSEVSVSVDNSSEQLLEDYIFDGDVLTTLMPAGEWQFTFSRKVSSTAGDTRLRFELYKRASNGTETVLFSQDSSTIEDTSYTNETILVIKSSYQLDETDRVGVKIYANTTRNSSILVSMIVGNGGAAYIVTPLGLRHNQLRARDEVDSHPIGAITGLQGVLDAKLDLAGGTIIGDLTIDGNIIQNGAAYETHAEQVFTTKDEVVLRDGAVGGLLNGVYSGLRFKLYDGTNDGLLAVGNDGIARVGDEGSLQAIATREDNPVDGNLVKWNDTLSRFDSTTEITVTTINGRNYDTDMTTLDNVGTFAEFTTAYEGV